jgi:hypothetical protein
LKPLKNARLRRELASTKLDLEIVKRRRVVRNYSIRSVLAVD